MLYIMRKVFLDITGMSCSACSSRIEKVVGRMEGVEEITVNLLTNKAQVNYDEGKLNTTAIIARIEKLGFGAALHQETAKLVVDKPKNTAAEELTEMRRRLLISLAFTDCVGRNRLNIDRDRRRETTAVESGIMLSGQQMPTSDIAMFSRMIFLKFNKVVFSAEEAERLKQFKARYELGCSHLTTEILKYRKRFEAGWKVALDSTAHDFRDLVAGDVETRISDNWIEALAAFRCLEAVLDTTYSYSELLRIFVAGAEAQNCEVSQTNELADFWTYVAFLKQDGKLIEGADYKIQHVKRIRRKGMSTLELDGSTPILFLRLERIQQLFAQANRGEGKVMGATQKYYLEHATYYYGKTYKKMDDTLGGVPIVKTESDAFGSRRTKQTTTALVRCFDYNRLRDVYDISLESSLVDESEPDDDCD